MALPGTLADSIGRQDRVYLLQWNQEGTELVPVEATMDQLGALVVQQIALAPDLVAGVPKNLSGAGAPSDSLGIDGDSYIDLTSGETYRKASGEWELIGSIAQIDDPRFFSLTNVPIAVDTDITGVSHSGKMLVMTVPVVLTVDITDVADGFVCSLVNLSGGDVVVSGPRHPLGHTILHNDGIATIIAAIRDETLFLRWGGNSTE